MPKLRSTAGWVYIAALHVAFAGAVLKPNAFTKVRQHLGMDTERAEFLAKIDDRHRKLNQLAGAGDVVFLGDSITEALPQALVVERSLNFGIPGESTVEMLARIDNYKQAIQAARLVSLEIGINDFIEGKHSGLPARYQQILSHIPANKPLVVSAVMPLQIGPRMHFTLDDVRAWNRQLKALCAQRPRCNFVDTWQSLATNDDAANPAFFDGDGVHLNAAGYARWISQLSAVVKEVEVATDKPAA